MRACEGCRRRKIKCDAATTNTWPCSACSRLKLQCVPPTMIDQDFSGADHVIDPQEASSYHFVNPSDSTTVENTKPPLDYTSKTSYPQFHSSRQVYQPALAPYSVTPQFFSADTQPRSYDGLYPSSHSAGATATDASQAFYPTVMAPLTRTTSEPSEQGSSTAEGLSEALGELKIDESGTGR